MAARRAARISTKSSRSAEAAAVGGVRAVRPVTAPRLAALALGLAALAVAGPAPGAGDAPAPRTIVVRGQVLTPEGKPVPGARVSARGTVSVNVMSNDRGRYTLAVPLGMPAAVKRLPFHLEVRVRADGRQVPLAGGGDALVLDVTWRPGTGRARVESNREAAVTAVATALEVEGVKVAWIEADFGGRPRPGLEGTFERDTPLAGGSAAKGGDAGATSRAAAPAAKARPARPPAEAGDAPTRGAAKPAPAPGASAAPKTATAKPGPAAGARRDSTPAAKAGPPARGAAADSGRRSAPHRAPSDSSRLVVTSRTAEAPAPRTAAGRAGKGSPADSCRCSLRGTVEIAWERPLEDNTPIRLTLDAPGARPADVRLFMGAPREFRFGPLPCGDWRLSFEARGRRRYVDQQGDTTRVVHCEGATETRVVLVPERR